MALSWLNKLNLLQNRRNRSRFDLSDVQYGITLQCENQVVTGWILDITQKGARLSCPNDVTNMLNPGKKCLMRVNTIDNSTSFSVPIQIVWSEFDEVADKTLLGCHFTKVSMQQTRMLSDIVEESARVRRQAS